MELPLLPAVFLFHFLLSISFSGASSSRESSPPISTSSIIFGAQGSRSIYAFDIFTLSTTTAPHPLNSSTERRITDGKSFNFNGHFPYLPSSSSLLTLLPERTLNHSAAITLVYATERGGSSNIYLDMLYNDNNTTGRAQVPLLKDSNILGASFKDKPTVTGDYLVYVSTHEDPGKPRASWAAVYSTHLKTALTQRLTPPGIADFSPAVSPSGVYTAVASYGERGWNGEVEVLTTDIYVFLTRDGTHRVKIVENGSWPTWVDDSTLYFHKRCETDGWISVYRAILPTNNTSLSIDSVTTERVTPPGIHAFTPATCPGNRKFIAVATRRPNSDYRHIELFDLVKKEFIELTRLISPQTQHFNPFISPDSFRVGYHKCRGSSKKSGTSFMLENLYSPVPEISLFRIDGYFPSWSPAGDRIAYVYFPAGLYVANRDGSNHRQVYSGTAFVTVWDPVRPGIVYASAGPILRDESTEVDIFSINVDQAGSYRKLTTNAQNNAFPAVSPDGKWIVFRSGRSGHKNLYIMDAFKGETGGLFRLTKGSWTDTMCNWSPNGELIAFSSNREDPSGESFSIFLIHPNGTGLRKLFQSGSGGRANHPYFSPDGKSIVFTTDYGGISAEPISTQHMFQPHGEIYTIKLDGSDLKRWTHNSYEDGTPAWGRNHVEPVDLAWPNHAPAAPQSQCSFTDSGWSWFSDTNHHSAEAESMMSGKPVCGA